MNNAISQCSIEHTDTIYKGIFIRHYNNYPGNRTILHCHGTGGISTDCKKIVETACNFKLNLVLFDYTGFGRSRGTPHQFSFKSDCEKAYEYISGITAPENIIIWGESLGGNPAVYLAEKTNASLLVIWATFSSAKDVFTDYGSLWNYGKELIEYTFDPINNLKRIANVKVRVIIIHSTEDELLPFKNAERLYNAVPHDNKVLFAVKGTHREPEFNDSVYYKVMNYLSAGDLTVLPNFLE
jgi:fermentation-respiration switch protein FrsA (DUF1100 family)